MRIELSSVLKHDEEELMEVRWFDFADLPFERSNPLSASAPDQT